MHKVALWLGCIGVLIGCSAAPTTQRYTLPLPVAGEQVHFTLRDRGKKLIHIEIVATTTLTQTIIRAQPPYAPSWLHAAGGELIIQSTKSGRVIVDGDCTRPADDIPPIDPAAIIGPQPGYLLDPSTGTYGSTDGNPLWRDYRGTAAVTDGALMALSATGTGAILLPDNTTRSGTYNWTYQRSPFHTIITPVSTPCSDTGLDAFPLPAGTGTPIVSGGILTARHPDAIAVVATAVTDLLAAQGTLTTIDSTPTRIVLQYATPTATYIVLLDARDTGGTTIQVYRAD